MEGFLLNDWENQTNYIISTYQKFIEQDISEVYMYAKFQCISVVQCE